MVEDENKSKILSISISVGMSLGILAILVLQVTQNKSQNEKIDELGEGYLSEGSITYDQLAEDVFTTVDLELEDGSTSKAKVLSGTVQGGLLTGRLQLETEKGEVIGGTVTGYVPVPIEDGSITEKKLAKVLIERIEALEEGSEEEGEEETVLISGLVDGSVVTVKLADEAVTTAKLADGSVTTIKIVDASITSGKIQDATILTKDLANGSITSVKIVDGTIVNADISNTAAIAYSKLNLTGSLLLADLGQNGCTDGQVMKWDNGGSTWACADDIDTDTNTQLSEAQVEGYITDEAIDLFTGSTMNSVALATETWVTGLGYITDGNTNWDNSYGFITGSSTEALTNKSGNISMWTNDSGYITDGNTNWDNSYGFITGSSTETLTNKSGNISMWTNDSSYLTSFTETDPTLTNDGTVILGSGSISPVTLTFNADGGTDGTITWSGVSDIFETNGSFLAGNGSNTGFGPATCPTGMIPVPPSNGRNGFCVDKYEAKQSGSIAVSQASGSPWATIAQYDARKACIVAGKHLITDAEWIQIAQNVEQVGWNWNGGVVGTNYMSDGHSDNVPASSLVADITGDPDDDPCVNTGQVCDLTTWNTQRRTYKLSNGEYIWDFGGNVWDWVDAFTYANYPIANNWLAWLACTNPDGICGNTIATNDQRYGGNTTDLRAVLRGGYWVDGTNDGGFAVNLDHVPSSTNAAVGFRCAR